MAEAAKWIRAMLLMRKSLLNFPPNMNFYAKKINRSNSHNFIVTIIIRNDKSVKNHTYGRGCKIIGTIIFVWQWYSNNNYHSKLVTIIHMGGFCVPEQQGVQVLSLFYTTGLLWFFLLDFTRGWDDIYYRN